MTRRRLLVLYAGLPGQQTYSYQLGWPRFFSRSPRFDCVMVDVADRQMAALVQTFRAGWMRRVDAVVILHSVFSNACALRHRLFEFVRRMPQPKAYFITNEYKALPEKMAFSDRLGVALLVTMNPNPVAQAMYRERLGCAVACLPSAGLDVERFACTTQRSLRPIHLGYRAADAPLYLGHTERLQLAEYFQARTHEWKLTSDISLDPEARLDEAGWAAFLNQCQGQLGSEAGYDYFELTDATRLAVNAHMSEHPDSNFDDIFERFFRHYPQPVSARMISGRQVEAAATRTVQILFDGEYSGYLHPDEDYIPLRKDFSNADEAIAKFRDAGFCDRLTAHADDVVRSELTYEHLIGRFSDALTPLL